MLLVFDIAAYVSVVSSSLRTVYGVQYTVSTRETESSHVGLPRD